MSGRPIERSRQTMRATISNVNIRGCEAKSGRGGDYLLVRFEDAYGKPSELVDKQMDRQPYYKRDTIGDLLIDIMIGKYTTIRIVDFKIAE